MNPRRAGSLQSLYTYLCGEPAPSRTWLPGCRFPHLAEKPASVRERGEHHERSHDPKSAGEPPVPEQQTDALQQVSPVIRRDGFTATDCDDGELECGCVGHVSGHLEESSGKPCAANRNREEVRPPEEQDSADDRRSDLRNGTTRHHQPLPKRAK